MKGSNKKKFELTVQRDRSLNVGPSADRGLIVQLQHFSLHDGDGIRSTIFMAGCPLHCRWCANPESWELSPLHDSATGKPLRSWMTLDEIVSEIRRQSVFYRYSGGGVTYSGGEPTVQQAFLRKMTETFSAMGIDQAIETCGFFEWQDVEDILRQMDTIFVDIKTMDPEQHRQLTGCGNEQILNNIKRMGVLNKQLIIRIPLIPGVNDSAENLKATADFVRSETPGAQVEILPYHPLGLEKYDRLGLKEQKYTYRVPEPAEINRVHTTLREYGVSLISFK